MNKTIDSGTQMDISVGDTVDLKNGQMADVVKNLQEAINNAPNHALDFNILGVYEGNTGGDAWNEKNTTVNAFWQSQLTNVWKSSEFKHDPNVQAMLDEMYPDANAQKKLNGVIQFKILGPSGTTGPGGSPLPSNTYTIMPKLVQ